MYLDHLKATAEILSSNVPEVQYSEILEESVSSRELESEFDMALLRMEYCQKMGSESFGDALSDAAARVKEIIIKLVEIATSILAKVRDFIVMIFKKVFEFIGSIIKFISEVVTGEGGGGGNGLSELKTKTSKEKDPKKRLKIVAKYLSKIKFVNKDGKIYSFQSLDVDKIVNESLEDASKDLSNQQISSLKSALKEMFKKEKINKSNMNKRITSDLQDFKSSCESLTASTKKALKELDVNSIKRDAEQNPEETEKMAAYRAALNVTNRLNEFVGRIGRDSAKVGVKAANVYKKMHMPKDASGECEVIFFDFKHFFSDFIKPSFDLVAKAKDVTAQYIASLKSTNKRDFKEMREKYRGDIIKILHADFTKNTSIDVGNEAGLFGFLTAGGAVSALVGGIMLVSNLCNAATTAKYGVEMTSENVKYAEAVMDHIEKMEESIHEDAYMLTQTANLLTGDNIATNANTDEGMIDHSKLTELGNQFTKIAQRLSHNIKDYNNWLNAHDDGAPGTSIPFKNSADRFSPDELDSLSKIVENAASAFYKASGDFYEKASHDKDGKFIHANHNRANSRYARAEAYEAAANSR